MVSTFDAEVEVACLFSAGIATWKSFIHLYVKRLDDRQFLRTNEQLNDNGMQKVFWLRKWEKDLIGSHKWITLLLCLKLYYSARPPNLPTCSSPFFPSSFLTRAKENWKVIVRLLAVLFQPSRREWLHLRWASSPHGTTKDPQTSGTCSTMSKVGPFSASAAWAACLSILIDKCVFRLHFTNWTIKMRAGTSHKNNSIGGSV